MNIDLTPEDLDVIGAGLGELPMKVAKPVFDKIVSQFQAYKALENASAPMETPEELPPITFDHQP